MKLGIILINLPTKLFHECHAFEKIYFTQGSKPIKLLLPCAWERELGIKAKIVSFTSNVLCCWDFRCEANVSAACIFHRRNIFQVTNNHFWRRQQLEDKIAAYWSCTAWMQPRGLPLEIRAGVSAAHGNFHVVCVHRFFTLYMCCADSHLCVLIKDVALDK